MMFHEISEWLDDVLEGISDTGNRNSKRRRTGKSEDVLIDSQAMQFLDSG